MQNPIHQILLRSTLLLTVASVCGCHTTTETPQLGGPTPAAARSVDGLIRELYASVSFDRGGPDWPRFRSLVLPGSVYVFAARGDTPMQVMDLEAFVQDFRDFVASGDVAQVGFHENLIHINSTEFGGIAHVFTVFEPTVGSAARSRRGVDSIQLVKQDGRWWVASITTQFESADLKVPNSILGNAGD